jgi:hypothetical protein
MRAAVVLALQIKARNAAEDLEPGRRVAADLDLRFDRSERVERLVQQVAHDAGLWLIARGAHVADRQVVVDAHVALDKAGDLPVVRLAIVALEDEDVATAGGASVALAPARVVGVGERAADGVTQRFAVGGFSSSNAVCETAFFHAASCRTA